jgi:hypothetical protein
LFLVLPGLILLSCSRLDRIEQRLTDNEDKISHLEDQASELSKAIAALQEALRTSNTIKDVYGTAQGWKVVFSNGTSIDIVNGIDGQDGITPLLKVDAEGYICVSFDKGAAYSRLLDENGEPVKATGKDGAEGLSVRVVEMEDGRYAFETYYASDPDQAVGTTVTPFANKPGAVISSILEDAASRTITLTMADGTAFCFQRAERTPVSIVVVSAPEITMSSRSSAEIIFRVNPSDADFCYDISSGDCNIAIDRTAVLTRAETGYITTPTNYTLKSVEPVYNENGMLMRGQYKAIIKDTGESRTYDEMMSLVLTVGEKDHSVQLSSSAVRVRFCSNVITSFAFLKEDNPGCLEEDVFGKVKGNEILVAGPYFPDMSHLVARFETVAEEVFTDQGLQLNGFSANDFSVPVRYRLHSEGFADAEYTVKVIRSGLPVVVIDTKGQPVDSKEIWREGCDMRIYDADGAELYASEKLQIRGRGNTSWIYPKKPYALKLDKKASLLGMPKHKRWCLLSNWSDKTLMRNHISFAVAQATDMAWTPRGQYVELFLNGEHLGNYYLCEQIRVDENRVNIDEMEATDIDGDALTGGYLMELDTYFDEVNKFRSPLKNLPYNFKSPDEEVLQPEQFAYMSGFIESLETALYDDEAFATGAWEVYLDAETWADMFLVQEIAGNWEPNHPKSFYVYKPRLGKLKAGPAWDFDWWTYTPEYMDKLAISGALYYDRLLTDPSFIRVLKEHWASHKEAFAAIPDLIRATASELEISNGINFSMWSVTPSFAYDWNMSSDEAIESMITCYQTKLDFLDTWIASL